ncbi:hypothetical protein [Spirosoma panaciterrae]|uniref:hypothetical protein n=1 Tax=Spirosoma panaciterrae TaxID=496058 RepID=UPI000592C618|nr:hypothetical protein [Spirosoma panaciterrae]
MKTVLFLLCLCPFIVQAQFLKVTPEDTFRKHSYLLMRDGSVVRGQIVRQDSSLITVRVRGGDLSYVEADQVVKILAERPKEEQAEMHERIASAVFLLRDGTRLPGTFVKQNETMITVRKPNGQLTYFEPELLVRVDTVWNEMSQTSRSNPDGFVNRFSPFMLLNPTAINAEKGRFYYRNTWLYNAFDYGITRFWSIGASFVTPIPSVDLDSDDLFFYEGFLPTTSRLYTKLSVPLGNKVRMGLNVMYQDKSKLGYYTRGPLTFNALATFGSAQRNVTAGFGFVERGKRRYYYANPMSYPYYLDTPIENQLYITMGLMQKVSPSLTVLSDNRVNLGDYSYYPNDFGERVSLSFALRIDRHRHAFDLGFYSQIFRDGLKYKELPFRMLPYLSYNLSIGRE